MTPEMLILIMTVASVITIYITRGVLTDRIPPIEGVVGGMAGTGLWALVAYEALSVTVGTDGPQEVHETWLPLSFLGLVLAVVCIAITLLDGVEMARTEVDL